MRILQVLYYYEPYTSGLTVYAARLSRELAARGHAVSVLASRHDSSLPSTEVTAEGVHIRRIPVAMSLDRAVIVPTLIPTAAVLMRTADVIHLHLPMAETAALVALGRVMGKRVIVTHHADLVLEGSRVSRVAATIARWSGIAGGKISSAFVTNTASRARVSPVARYMSRNLSIVAPPIIVRAVEPGAGDTFRRDFGLGSGPVIGYVGRYASEKGIDVLLQTIPAIREKLPDTLVALAGPRRDARDGSLLRGPWDRWLAKYAAAIRQLDYLSDDDLARFYAACDVLVLPSTDWTESFGMVQIEAMLRGTPVVASNLPGVADPIALTGYGELVRTGDVDDLACSIIKVLTEPERFRPDPGRVAARYSLAATVDAYERLYRGEDAPGDPLP
ncbi:MAG TPA: glycosyltransferase family 4 protein [Thermomicrobiales bacterium]|nr:glycosyltransferase family 4 protein [Thermomicrobiales bacterium]